MSFKSYLQSYLNNFLSKFRTSRKIYGAELSALYNNKDYDNGSVELKNIFSNNEVVAKNAAKDIKIKLKDVSNIHQWYRIYKNFAYYVSDDLINNTSIKQFKKFLPEESVHLYGIAAINQNGYVREKALDYLANIATAEILPYIVIRLNDWVEPIRKKANSIMLDILSSISLHDIIKYYHLIEWLEVNNIVPLKDIQNVIFKQICEPSNRSDIWKIMQQSSIKIRSFCWKILAEEVMSDNDLIDKAIQDSLPKIRQWIASSLPESNNFKFRINILFNDHVSNVRYHALKRISHDNFSEYKELFEKAIFDSSKKVREYGRYVLGVHGYCNFVEQYQQKILHLKEKSTLGAIAGLVETGTKKDMSLIEKFVNHKNSKIRAAVLLGFSKFKIDGVDELYYLGLKSSNAKVRNTCVLILQDGYSYLIPKLKELLQTGDIKSKQAALIILTKSNMLDSLYAILYILALPHEKLQNIAWKSLISWHSNHKTQICSRLDNDTYESIVILFNTLRKRNITPLNQAYDAWNNLPNIIA